MQRAPGATTRRPPRRQAILSQERPTALTRVLQRAVKVEPNETAAVVTAFLLFFCVLGGYFAVRPVRETVGTILGPDRTADLFVATWIASLAIVPIYGALCTRFRRSAFLPWIYGFVAIALATIGVIFQASESSIAAAQFFFVFISVLNLFVVSVFWSFLLEIFDTGQTKRLFGTIAAGGTAGALGGPVLTDLTVRFIGNAGVLFLGASLFVCAIICQRVLLRLWKTSDWGRDGTGALGERPIGGNPFAGFTLVLKSPYLIGIALFVVLLASVNTFLYFEQLRIVSVTFPDPDSLVATPITLIVVERSESSVCTFAISVVIFSEPISIAETVRDFDFIILFLQPDY
jgi:AAA family ATP:ADP antiporter